MSIEAVAEANRPAGIAPSVPWRIKALSVMPGYRLAVTFNDGTGGVADLSALSSSGDCGIYNALKDPSYFEKACLNLGAVTWPNGADLDPTWMHETMRQSGTWLVPF